MGVSSARSQPSISLVIPVWNDAAALAGNLPALLREWPANALWVVDGGSQDESLEVAKHHGAQCLKVPGPSRAAQMNAGAAASTGDAILFLHTDTHLPTGSRELIAAAISRGAIGGAFSRRFDRRSLFLQMACRGADWRGRWLGTFLGDQAIFTTRDGFEKAGGFPLQPLFEDFEFSRRLSRIGRTVLLGPPVLSSARRFEERGPVRQTLADFALTLRYLRRGPAILGPARQHTSEGCNVVGQPLP